MGLWKIILFGAILWVLIFFEVSILMFGFGLTSGIGYYIPHYLLLIVLTGLVAAIYFKRESASFKKGILTGIVFAVIGVVLDFIITVPLFVKDYGLMFGNLMLWIGMVLGILVVGVVGAIRK